MFWKSLPAGPWAGSDGSGNPRGTPRGGVGTGGGRGFRHQPRVEPYSLAHLRALFQRLIDAQEGRGEGGETTVVETLRAISEVVVYGENQDAKIAAKAAKSEALFHQQQQEGADITADNGSSSRIHDPERKGVADGGGGRLEGNAGIVGVVEVRSEDAFFELFCEKNMMSRFLDLLQSPPSRYGNASSDPGKTTAPAWGTNGGLDAVVRALTWGGGVLGMGQGGDGGGGEDRPPSVGSSGRSMRGSGRGGSSRGTGARSSVEVQVQVIQTTSILVMNVKSDTSLFYLLSNNHVNDMIMFDFRLEDEEVLSHFASFLKTLSLRLNPNTVQFFLQGPGRIPPGGVNGGRGAGDAAVDGGEGGASEGRAGNKDTGLVEGGEGEEAEGENASFPLYTRALEYICHGDFHVRIAALTVVLNIYNQRDPLVKAYLNGPAARSASLPDRLVGALRSQCLVLADRAMAAGVGGDGGVTSGGDEWGSAGGGVSSSAAAAAMRDPGICRDSIAGLQDQVFYLEDVFASGQRELNAQLCESLVARFVRPLLLGDWLSGRAGSMFPQVALCALAQLFIVVTHPPLVRLLARETLGFEKTSQPGTLTCNDSGVSPAEGTGSPHPPPPLLALLQGDREELCLGALLVLQALVKNEVVRTDLGLLQPPKRVDSFDNDSNNLDNGSDSSDDHGCGDAEETAAAIAAAIAGVKGGDPSLIPLASEILDDSVDALCCLLTPNPPIPVPLLSGNPGVPNSTTSTTEKTPSAVTFVDQKLSKGGSLGDQKTASAVASERIEQNGAGQPASGNVGGEGDGRRNQGGLSTARGSEIAKTDVNAKRERKRAASYRRSANAPPPRRHHLVLRLCGKVLASLARPNPDSCERSDGGDEFKENVAADGATTGRKVDGSVIDVNARSESASSMNTSGVLQLPPPDNGHHADSSLTPTENVTVEQATRARVADAVTQDFVAQQDVDAAAVVGIENGGSAQGSGSERRRRDYVLRRVGEALAAAAEAVVSQMGDAEGASVVAFEEEVREWSKRVGLDGAITNLPKMSSLILRWSLEPNATPSPTQGGDAGGVEGVPENEDGQARRRELRSSLQAFLEIRHVWRVLAGQGGTDPDLFALAGLGPGTEEDQPREGGFLDLGGRECLACHITTLLPPGFPLGLGGGDEEGGAKRSKGSRRRQVVSGRRGRSELYLVLDAKAFLLATPDRHRLTKGEVKSAAPLLHLASAPDPADETRLHIRALSHRPVALMRPVTPPPPSTLGGVTSKKGGGAKIKGGGGNGKAFSARNGDGLGLLTGEAGAGADAGAICDMQAWQCELAFENERSCRLARKHMEGRRLRLRSEKIQGITQVLAACMRGRGDL